VAAVPCQAGTDEQGSYWLIFFVGNSRVLLIGVLGRRPMRLGGGLGGDSRLPKEPRKKLLAEAAAKGLPPPADERAAARYSDLSVGVGQFRSGQHFQVCVSLLQGAMPVLFLAELSRAELSAEVSHEERGEGWQLLSCQYAWAACSSGASSTCVLWHAVHYSAGPDVHPGNVRLLHQARLSAVSANGSL
jgi:hypothetical protein